MYLKRLEIQGFKSFPSRTVLEFGPGVTAVIGPNGSGKSNVSDAIRWVLGEQSARAMRLRKLEDALFAGGHKRAPSGFAEVSMWLDNAGGWLPLDFAEVVVTRRLHRSGDSDYLINRQRVRLRDVNDLFLRARLGQNSYAIMGQGLVDQVLSLRPDERRGLIEEAADVRRHRVRIDEAQARLGTTRENLEKVDLLVAEIAPRLTQLERQARRAREYGELSRELAEALHAWYGHEWRSRQERLVAARAGYDQLNASFLSAQADLERLEERLSEVRTRLEARRRQETAMADRLRRFQEEGREAAQRSRLEEERLVFVRRRLDELTGEMTALRAEREELAGSGLAGEAAMGDGLNEARTLLAAHQADQRTADLDLEQARRGFSQQDTAARRARGELRAAEDRLNTIEGQRQRIEQDGPVHAQRRVALLQRLAQIGRSFADRLQSLQSAEREAGRIEAEREVATRELQRLREAAPELETRLAQLRSCGDELTARRNLLLRMQEQHRGLDGAARSLAARTVDGHTVSVAGIVGDIISVPEGLEAAIEAALADYVSAAIVRDEAALDGAVHALSDAAAGRATVIPLARSGPTEGRKPTLPPGGTGVVGVAARLVSCEPRFSDLVDLLLGQTVVVEDIETARAIAASGATAVTRSGVLFRSNGAVSAGSAGPSGTRFALDRELAELPSLLEHAIAERAATEVEHLAARQRMDAARKHANELTTAAETARRTVLRARERTHEPRSALPPVRDELRHLRGALQTAGERALTLSAQEAELRQHVADLRARASEADAKVTAARRQVNDAVARRDRLQTAVADARGAVAALEREQQALLALRERQRVTLARLEERTIARAREADARRSEIAQVEADRALLRRGVSEAGDGARQVEEELTPLREHVRSLAREVEELEPLAARRRRALAEVERACLTAEAGVHRHARDLEHLREEIAGEGLEPPEQEASVGVSTRDASMPADAGLLQAPVGAAAAWTGTAPGIGGSRLPQPVADPAALQERIRVIRARIRSFGLINAQAEADFRESRERHDFLSTQLADLREAEQGLAEAIDELRLTVRERFREAFTRIGEDFERNFVTFFGGGTARLVLTEPEDYGESGVEIVARPPGKRLQSLSLLSGGERSMTAVALLFALLQSNPAPFCVLDEVDAALDESNVGRFGEALKALAERTQFVVITHNRVTIEAGDTIYGVSMGRDGASSVLSLRLADVPEQR